MLQEFSEQVEKMAQAVMEEMHTVIPAKITSFNPSTGMAALKPYGTYTTGAGKKIAYPGVTGVPVIIPQCPSATVFIAFPIKAGDDCLMLVSEQELDAWLGGGDSDNDMRFDLTSAIAIPGLSNKGNTVLEEACKSSSVIVANGSTKLKVNKSEVEIVGNLKVSGDVKAGSISLKDHTRTDSVGGSTTKPS